MNRLLVVVLVTWAVGLTGCNPMYSPCTNQVDCAQGLRCVNLGDQYGSICTRTCTISKNRSGYPDALDDDALYEDGTNQNTTISDEEAPCLEGGASVVTENGSDFEVTPEQEGDVIGVCRISDEQQASGELGGNSELTGWCVPL